MMLIHRFTLLVMVTALVSLTACTNSSNTASQPTADPAPTEAPMAESTPAVDDHSAPAKGGQVVETGKYHMEFVPIVEEGGVHLDVYLQTGDDHSAIADAAVMAQIQLPDGSLQEVSMEYDAAGEHYFAFLPSQATGEYKVVVLTDVGGEKVNGRFTFTK